MKTSSTTSLAGLFLSSVLQLGLHAASTIEFTKPTSVSVAENAGEVVLTVVRSGDVDAMVSADFTTADAAGKAGSDYTLTSGTLTFEAGQTNQPIVIPILNDTLPEATERFSVRLSSPSANATLGTTSTVQFPGMTSLRM